MAITITTRSLKRTTEAAQAESSSSSKRPRTEKEEGEQRMLQVEEMSYSALTDTSYSQLVTEFY